MIVKALSIRQPWCWLIMNGKDIENRTWSTKYRGRFLVHASAGMTRAEYDAAFRYAVEVNSDFYHSFPPFAELERGGIVGSVELVDVVDQSSRSSPWHMECCYGFKLANPEPIPFIPMKGRLGFFGEFEMVKIGAYHDAVAKAVTER